MKKARKVYQKLNMFYTLLLTTVLPCILATLLLAGALIPMMRGVASATDKAYGEVVLTSTASRVETLMRMVENQKRKILNASWLNELYFDHFMGEPLDYRMKNDILLDLGRMVAENPEIYLISFQFYDDPETIYSSSGVFADLPFLRNISPDNIYYRFYHADATEAGYSTIEFNGKLYMLYYSPFSNNAGGRDKGVINILLRHQVVGEALATASDGYGTAFSLLDNSDETVWSWEKETTERSAILSKVLENGAYTLTMSLPRELTARTRAVVMPRMLLTLAIGLLVSVALSYLLSRFSYRPIQAVVERFVDPDAPGGNEMFALEQVFDRVLNEKSLSEVTLAHLRPIARQKILSSLMDGTAFLEDDVEDQLLYCRIALDHDCYNVISMTVPFSHADAELSTSELAMETLVNHLCQELPVCAYVFSLDTDRLRLLVNYQSWDQMQTFLSRLLTECKDYFRKFELDRQIFLGVGQMVPSLEELYRCAEQADTAMNVAVLNRLEQPMFYSEVSSELNYEYFYPFSDELLLSRTISNCNTVSAKAQLNTIIEENKRNSKLAPKALQLLYMDIFSTLARSGRSLGISIPPAEPVERLVTLDEIQRRLETLIDDICQQIGARHTKTVRSGEQKILDYIDQHLFDAGLSLSGIASAFGMSNAYISSLIKDHYETNYSNFINQARILKAIQLMNDQGLSPGDVYAMVGYTNLSTFRRNYSKYANGLTDEAELPDE